MDASLLKAVPPEVAMKEFDRFCEEWDIETDFSEMSQDDIDSFNQAKNPIVKAIKKGRLVVLEDGRLEVYLVKSDLLERDSIILDVSKADLLAMDNHKEGRNMHKSLAYSASMAGIPEKLMYKVHPVDFKIIQKVVLLFLGS